MLVIRDKKIDESSLIEDIMSAFGIIKNKVVLLKYDGYRTNKKWTITNMEGRVADTDNPKKTLFDLLTEEYKNLTGG